jgi:hypothetical protein
MLICCLKGNCGRLEIIGEIGPAQQLQPEADGGAERRAPDAATAPGQRAGNAADRQARRAEPSISTIMAMAIGLLRMPMSDMARLLNPSPVYGGGGREPLHPTSFRY